MVSVVAVPSAMAVSVVMVLSVLFGSARDDRRLAP
jgi:hypothetical protein